MKGNKRYYIVVGQALGRVPIRHDSAKAATTEAKRLALLHPNVIFTVFVSINETQNTRTLWTKIRKARVVKL
jgi:uncharacterized protein YmfQ (DUF2313 family)